jgi:hypothetical protein
LPAWLSGDWWKQAHWEAQLLTTLTFFFGLVKFFHLSFLSNNQKCKKKSEEVEQEW